MKRLWDIYDLFVSKHEGGGYTVDQRCSLLGSVALGEKFASREFERVVSELFGFSYNRKGQKKVSVLVDHLGNTAFVYIDGVPTFEVEKVIS